MKSNLRIAFLAGTLGRGGAEKQLGFLMDAAKELGYETCLYSLTSGEYWEAIYKNRGTAVRSSPSRTRLGRICFLRREWGLWQPHAVICLHFFSTPYALALKPLFGYRLIACVRSDGFSEFSVLPQALTKLVIKNSSALTANSHSGYENLRHSGIEYSRLFYLPNVIRRPDNVLHSKESTVLVVGRLVQAKRVDRALEIVAKTRMALGNSFNCRILGDGPLRKTLEKFNSLIGANAEFLGLQDDLTSHYQHAAVILLTSDYEGTPNVILEAMAHRCAVLATNVGELPNLVQNGLSGFLFSPDSQEAAAAHLIQLLTNEALRQHLADNAWNTLDIFDLQNLKSKMKKMIEAVC